jgi:hypothetical protein
MVGGNSYRIKTAFTATNRKKQERERKMCR